MKRYIINAVEKDSKRKRTFAKFVWENMLPQDREKFILDTTVNPEVSKTVELAGYTNAVNRAQGFAADGEHAKALQMWKKAQAISDNDEVRAGIADAEKMIDLANAAIEAAKQQAKTPAKPVSDAVATLDASVIAADEAFTGKNYMLALELYETAKDQNDKHVKAQIAAINKILSSKK